jgi:hypothetical protein
MKVTDYEVVDHGVEGAQYFQGCGVALTKYSDVATGCGDSFADALDDALESIAQQQGIDVEDLEARINADGNAVSDGETVPEDAEDCYYYVSVRFTSAEGDA